MYPSVDHRKLPVTLSFGAAIVFPVVKLFPFGPKLKIKEHGIFETKLQELEVAKYLSNMQQLLESLNK